MGISSDIDKKGYKMNIIKFVEYFIPDREHN